MPSPKLSRNRETSRERSISRSPKRQISKGFKGRPYRERSRSRSEIKDKTRTTSKSPERFEKYRSSSLDRSPEKRKGSKRRISVSPKKYKRRSESSSSRSPSTSRTKIKIRSRSRSSHQKSSGKKKSKKKSKKRKKSSRTSESDSSALNSSPVKKIKKQKDNRKKSPGCIPSSPEYRPTAPIHSPEYRPGTKIANSEQYGHNSPEYRATSPTVSRSRSRSPTGSKNSFKKHKSVDHRFLKPSTSGYKMKPDPDLTPHYLKQKLSGESGVCSTPRLSKILGKGVCSPPRSKIRESGVYSPRSKTQDRGVCSPPRSKTRDRGVCSPPRSKCSPPRSKTRDRGVCSPPRSKTRDRGVCSPPRSKTREMGVCSPPTDVKLRKSKKDRVEGPDPFNLKGLDGMIIKPKKRHPSKASSESEHTPPSRSGSRNVSPTNRASSSHAKSFSRTTRDISQTSSQSVSLVTATNDCAVPAVLIKTEPDMDEHGMVILPPIDVAVGKGLYFKPDRPNAPQQFGKAYCHLCSAYIEDDDIKKSLHLKQEHQFHVFKVTLPRDIFLYDIEEVIAHYAKLDIDNGDIATKLFDCNLVMNPPSLEAFTCGKCPEGQRFTNFTSVDECCQHIRDSCQVAGKHVQEYVIPWCRLCHSRFESVSQLYQHTNYTREVNYKNNKKNRPCFPNKKIRDKIYDSVKNKPMIQPDAAVKREIKSEFFNSRPEVMEVLARPSAPAIDAYKNFSESIKAQNTDGEAFNIFSDLEQQSSSQNMTAGPTADIQNMMQPRRVRNPSITDLQNILNAVGGGASSASGGVGSDNSLALMPDMSNPPPGYSGMPQQPTAGFYPSTNVYNQHIPSLPLSDGRASIVAPLPASLGHCHPGYRNAPPGMFGTQQRPSLRHDVTTAIQRAKKEVLVKREPKLSELFESQVKSSQQDSSLSLPRVTPSPTPTYSSYPSPTSSTDPSSKTKSNLIFVPPPPSTPLPSKDDLFNEASAGLNITSVSPRDVQFSVSPPPPRVSPVQIYGRSSQPLVSPVQPYERSSQPLVSPVQPYERSSQPLVSPVQPYERSSQPLVSPVQPYERSSQPLVSPVQPYERSSQPLVSPVQPYERPSSSCYSVNSDDSIQFSPVRVIDEDKCRTSSCCWDDRHSGECNKPAIKIRCDSDICEDKDLHVNEYKRACPKLNHNCSNGPRKLISLEIQSAEKEVSINEDRHIPWRLLYHKKSTVLSDPRRSVDNYPRRSSSPSRVLDVWFINPSDERPDGGDVKVYAWSCLKANKLSFNLNNNPHVVEESDDEIEVEYEGPMVTSLENEVAVGERKQARQYRKRQSLEDGEWSGDGHI